MAALSQRRELHAGYIGDLTTRDPDGTCILNVDGEAVALGREFCERLFVVVI